MTRLPATLSSGSPLGTLLRLIASLRHPVSQRRLRSELYTRLRYGSGHLQGSTFTHMDRFPVLFNFCRVLLASHSTPRILSFGCSTGEEVFTLARYLPHAEIIGVDLNRWCLARARQHQRLLSNARICFHHARSSAFAAEGGFDVIFALAVFQRTENALAASASGFRFRTFEQFIRMLDQKLKPGGVLFLDQCDFAFADTSVAPRYQPLAFPASNRARDRALFGPDDTLRTTAYSAPRAYRKAVGRPDAEAEAEAES